MLLQITDWFQQFGSENANLQYRLIGSGIIVILLIISRLLVVRLVNQRSSNQETRYRWRKTADYLAYFVGLLLLIRLWFADAQGLATYLGFATAGLAIALQEPIANLFGWFFIVSRRPFEVGDRVEVAGVAGDVIDLSPFQFTLMEVRNWVDADQSTGRIVHLPNRVVFSEPVGNFNQGLPYIWHEIPVLVTFESDWEQAKQILQKIVETLGQDIVKGAMRKSADPSRRYLVNYGTLTPTVYTKVDASGVRLTVRSLCNPRQRRNFEQQIWEEVLRRFDEIDDIQLAYPTQRINLSRSTTDQS